MTARPEDLRRRLAGLDQIDEVVGALRAIASGQSAAARSALPAIEAHALTTRRALARLAASQVTATATAPAGPGLLLVIGASQGFAGAYPQRVAAATLQGLAPDTGLLVVGRRTVQALLDRGRRPLWSADLPGHPAAIPALASEVTAALLAQAVEHPGPIHAIAGLPGAGHAPTVVRLFPPEPVAPAQGMEPPLMTLAPAVLMTSLLQEALFAAVARALMRGLEAEAAARMQAMAQARSNLQRRRNEVEAAYRQARQEQMTTEMIELASGR
ncbi:F-type H+-transporting ATPase subunit gamma [Pseudacidovorax intermedius]|uniref:F-type H+-transporting ATPase subunit gamma n=1 Tax=Pseudacidovorax intermedius TaxID=433924 RepID=A0A370F8R1_9BURK|nr:F0F1 ATP synthase subunit gamma [Pseudacidovorax intermedius]RDI18195.1 F-type H+-transporting ATPase subunit gamma [Pseudacidovorax intermedius]